MKGLFLVLAATPAFALAGDGILGTKTDIVTAPVGSSVGWENILQMLVALGIVLFLIRWAMPKVLSKVNRKLLPGSGSIKIEETAAFGGGNLYIVEARGKTLLLAATTQGVSCLADLTETNFAQKQSDEEVFRDFLASAEATVVNAPIVESTDTALDRLNRLLP